MTIEHLWRRAVLIVQLEGGRLFLQYHCTVEERRAVSSG